MAAKALCEESLSIKRDLADRSGEATVLNNIGAAFSDLGQYQKALDSYTRSLAIYQGMGISAC